MKTIETANNINYQQAIETCQDPTMGDPAAYPMTPYSEDLHSALKEELSNATLTETEFWIGNFWNFIIVEPDFNIRSRS